MLFVFLQRKHFLNVNQNKTTENAIKISKQDFYNIKQYIF